MGISIEGSCLKWNVLLVMDFTNLTVEQRINAFDKINASLIPDYTNKIRHWTELKQDKDMLYPSMVLD